jgi:HAD superfamily hydrolase (TIGR01509 family)
MTVHRLKAVLFDMDGLFVDTEHAWFEAEQQVMAELGGSWSDADAEAMVGGPLDRAARYMVDKVGHGDPARVAQLLVDTMAGLLEAGADHRPGADDLLEQLVRNGVECALVSSSPRILVDAVLDSVGGDRFQFTIAGDEVTRTKPFPDPYLAAMRRLRVQPASCIVLEDSPTGVMAGEAAGCLVVGVPFAASLEPAPGRVIVTSLTELSTQRLDALLAQHPASPTTGP